MVTQSKLLVILGPTSTGKTDLGIGLAQKFNGEIISADSRQVYKYLDIGTGKLPGSFKTLKKSKGFWEIDGIKIWMYDKEEPKNRFNLYEYVTQANKIIKDIATRGKLPVLVGGTGLYIRSLIEGISDFGTGEVEDLRLKLESLGIDEIRKKIKLIDPEILGKLNNSELNNKRRLVRLVEKLTYPGIGKSYPGLENDSDVLKIGLTADKDLLGNRIKERVRKRIDQGMVEEAKDLLARKILSYERMEELGLEYRYLSKLLKGEIKNIEEFTDILSTKIRQFAKRQMTWFKKEKNTDWFDTGKEGFGEKVEYKVANWYTTSK